MRWIGEPHDQMLRVALMYHKHIWLKGKIAKCKFLNTYEILITMENGEKYIFNEGTTAIRHLPTREQLLDDHVYDQEFMCRVRSAMMAAHIGVSNLAERTGISERTISRYLNMDSSPTTRNLHKIVNAIGCDILDVLPIDYD